MLGEGGSNTLKYSYWLVVSAKKMKSSSVANRLHVVELEALETYNTFTWEEKDDKNKMKKILEKLEAHHIPHNNIMYKGHFQHT